MKNLLKNNCRYVLKNKFIMLVVLVLLSIAIMVFSAFTNLAVNINKVYNNLVQNYNLHNIVINERYSNNNDVETEQKQTLASGLTDLGIEYRQFNSLNVTNTSNTDLLKVIEYVASYSIDRLDVFNQEGLPTNIYGDYVLPNSLDFEQIISDADIKLTSSENILARQKLVYFMSKANFKVESFNQEFASVWATIVANPSYDPITPLSSIDNNQVNVAKYLNAFLDSTNSKYSPIIVRGNRITITLTEFNGGIPSTGYFEDPYAYLAMISNAYLEANNKKVYSFSQYKQDILETSSRTTSASSGLDLLTNNPATFPNIKSTADITNFINSSVGDEYKIYVDNIPYLIVGTGVTPDFVYPILSFANTIPNPKNEALIYTNSNGYKRAETSFASSPHESFLVAKYSGDLPKATILSEINKLTKKSMSWPANVTAAYWYNDINNKLTPTALRIQFINTLISTFIITIITLTIFVLILVSFVIVLFIKRFITHNKVNIAISISNGISKMKILFSIALTTSSICIVCGPLGLVLGWVLQGKVFSFLENYWFLPTPIEQFSPMWYVIMIVLPMIIFSSLIFLVGWWFLKDNLVNLLKQTSDLKITRTYLVYHKFINYANVMYKLRSSIIFSSLSKIVFITLLSTLALSTITFASSATSKLSTTYALETQTNTSSYGIDLVTPTKQGGQYFGVSIQQAGTELTSTSGTNLTNINYDNSMYATLLQSSPLFKKYAALFWASYNDSTAQKTDINYIKNKVGNQLILNYFFGIGSLGTNPWNISKSLMPINQINTSNKLTISLLQKMLSDLRPYNQAFFGTINNLTTITPNEDKNANVFPSEWVIQNFDMLDNPSDWKLVYTDKYGNTDANIGVINASEIYDDNGEQLRWLTPESVLKDKDQLASILNNSYQTYGSTYTSETVTDDVSKRLYPKLYGSLFTQDAISNVNVKNGVVHFSVDVNNNDAKSLITTRSMLLKQFLEKVTLEDSSDEINNGEIILDPLDTNSYAKQEYGYQLTNVAKVLLLNTDFIKLFIHVYNDPSYFSLFYRILNNYAILDPETDEPYAYIEGAINNQDTIKVIGIRVDSSFINLRDNKNTLINDLLFANTSDNIIPLIINNYAAKKYKLKVGSIVSIQAQNDVNRFEYSDDVDASDVLLNNNLSFSFKTSPIYQYKVVGINNTGNDSQFYISLLNAQNVLGLATSTDYTEGTNITTTNNNEITIGMNNQWNKLGGFNGIFTSSINPIMLSSSVAIYSPSGLYPGSDAWNTSQEMTTLVSIALQDETTSMYLANALDITNSKLQSIRTQLQNTQSKSDTDIAKQIISILNAKYGNNAFATIYENASSLVQQKTMFNQLSTTFDSIVVAVATLLIILSLIIIAFIASMVINDLLKITAILTTLGYTNKQNAITFFALFALAWLISLIVAGPICLVLNSLMEFFMFANVNLFIQVNFNFLAFFLSTLGFTGIFALIFWWGLRWFKKNNLLDALKW